MLISIQIIGQQQNVEPELLEVERKTLRYKINNANRTVTVTDFYMSRFPESVKEYKLYLFELDSLGVFDENEHLPRAESLRTIGLKQDEVDFIRNEYYVEEAYGQYPIIGLDYAQIQLYLEWKSEYVRKRILKDLGIQNPDHLTYIEILEKYKNEIDIPMQVDFLIPHEEILISAFTGMGRYHGKLDAIDMGAIESIKENTVFKRLNLKHIFEYDLTNVKQYDKLDELILQGMEMELDNIHSVGKNNYTKSNNPNQILKPFRVWNINISGRR